MALIDKAEKKKVRIDEEYFIEDGREEKPRPIAKVESEKLFDIKIDEDYIKTQEESLEGKDTTFSEDDSEFKVNARKLEKDLVGITVPEFKSMWKAHSAAFNDCEVKSEAAFRSGPILSIGYQRIFASP
ncbi:MAG: hypothetical protein P4M11_00040 [Candidatus Pacebacteria bacterium]|nr:hypothetical protein [Candidatus Paceibacterota bacterium]